LRSFLPGLPLRALCTVLAAACGGGGGGGGLPGSTKQITAFSLAGATGVIKGTTIYVKGVPLYTDEGKTAVTDLTNLSPLIIHNGIGVDVSPGSGPATDFSRLIKTYIVTAEDGSTAAYTVVVSLEPLDTGGGIASAVDGYIGADTGADTTTYSDAAAPVPLPVKIDFSTGWSTLLSAINDADKLVALDLSACTMSDPEFDPGKTIDTGKAKIVSLVLPETATSLTAGGNYDNAAFKYFTALESVSGAGIETVGGSAFAGCKALETVSLPAATSIGGGAFAGCTALQTVSLPAATSIGEDAFGSCKALQTVSLPAATSIGDTAFNGCTALQTISLPAATGIGLRAFDFCTALETVSLPAATSIGGSAFYDCSALKTASLPAAQSIGYSAFSGCTALETLRLPAAQDIGDGAFEYTGAAALTITLGGTVPTMGTNPFYDISAAKPVTVKVPSAAAAAYDSPWRDSFKGEYNNITVQIETY
jgi:hypothetical protein